MLSNRLLDSTLSIEMKSLRHLVLDKSRKVRLAFVLLLQQIKEQRLEAFNCFDIVPKSQLVLSIATDPEQTALKITDLTIPSYFPIAREGQDSPQLSLIKCNACISMTENSFESSRFFCRHLFLFFRLDTLFDFAMTLFEYLRRSQEENESNGSRKKATKSKKSQSKTSKKGPKRRRISKRGNGNQGTGDSGNDNEQDNSEDDENIISINSNDEREQRSNEADEETHEKLFVIISDLLQSIRQSLLREKNKALRSFVNEMLGGSALKQYLVERGNSLVFRSSGWKIASCVSASEVKPLVVL